MTSFTYASKPKNKTTLTYTIRYLLPFRAKIHYYTKTFSLPYTI